MRYSIIFLSLCLSACGARYDASRQCWRDAGGFSTAILYTQGGIIADPYSPAGIAYHQQLKDCMARYDAKAGEQ